MVSPDRRAATRKTNKRPRITTTASTSTNTSTSTSATTTTWQCRVCTLENQSSRRRCGACETRRPVDVDVDDNRNPSAAEAEKETPAATLQNNSNESNNNDASSSPSSEVALQTKKIGNDTTTTTTTTSQRGVVASWLQQRHRRRRNNNNNKRKRCQGREETTAENDAPDEKNNSATAAQQQSTMTSFLPRQCRLRVRLQGLQLMDANDDDDDECDINDHDLLHPPPLLEAWIPSSETEDDAAAAALETNALEKSNATHPPSDHNNDKNAPAASLASPQKPGRQRPKRSRRLILAQDDETTTHDVENDDDVVTSAAADTELPRMTHMAATSPETESNIMKTTSSDALPEINSVQLPLLPQTELQKEQKYQPKEDQAVVLERSGAAVVPSKTIPKQTTTIAEEKSLVEIRNDLAKEATLVAIATSGGMDVATVQHDDGGVAGTTTTTTEEEQVQPQSTTPLPSEDNVLLPPEPQATQSLLGTPMAGGTAGKSSSSPRNMYPTVEPNVYCQDERLLAEKENAASNLPVLRSTTMDLVKDSAPNNKSGRKRDDLTTNLTFPGKGKGEKLEYKPGDSGIGNLSPIREGADASTTQAMLANCRNETSPMLHDTSNKSDDEGAQKFPFLVASETSTTGAAEKTPAPLFDSNATSVAVSTAFKPTHSTKEILEDQAKPVLAHSIPNQSNAEGAEDSSQTAEQPGQEDAPPEQRTTGIRNNPPESETAVRPGDGALHHGKLSLTSAGLTQPMGEEPGVEASATESSPKSPVRQTNQAGQESTVWDPMATAASDVNSLQLAKQHDNATERGHFFYTQASQSQDFCSSQDSQKDYANGPSILALSPDDSVKQRVDISSAVSKGGVSPQPIAAAALPGQYEGLGESPVQKGCSSVHTTQEVPHYREHSGGQIASAHTPALSSLTETNPQSFASEGAHRAMAAFQTAGQNLTLRVSESALRRAASILQSENTATQHDKSNQAPNDKLVKEVSRNDVSGMVTRIPDMHMAGPNKQQATPQKSEKGGACADFPTEAGSKNEFVVGNRPAHPTFQTAGKRQTITVSATDIARANTILGGGMTRISMETAANGNANETNVAFQTAGRNSTVCVSDAARAKSEQILEVASGSTKQPHKAAVLPPMGASARVHQQQLVAAFQTAGRGMSVTVSADDLAKASRLLVGKETQPAPLPPAVHTTLRHSGKATFQTSSRKPDMETANQNVPQSHRSQQSIAAFQTAGKCKSVTVSADDLAKTGKMLGGGEMKQTTTTTAVNVTLCQTGKAIFQTAGRQSTIRVSDEARARSEQVLGGTSGRGKPHHQGPAVMAAASHCAPHSNKLTLVAAFQTAGKGNSVNVSAEDLARAGKILQGEDSREASTVKSTTHQRLHAIFQTAGQQSTIRVSDAAWAKSEQFLRGTPEPGKSLHRPVIGAATCSVPQINGLTMTAAFQTAGIGALVTVSAEEFAQAGKMLGGGDTQRTQSAAGVEANLPQTGKALFQTAGQRSVIFVSDEAQTRSEQFFKGATGSGKSVLETPGSDATGHIAHSNQRKARVSFSSPGERFSTTEPEPEAISQARDPDDLVPSELGLKLKPCSNDAGFLPHESFATISFDALETVEKGRTLQRPARVSFQSETGLKYLAGRKEPLTPSISIVSRRPDFDTPGAATSDAFPLNPTREPKALDQESNPNISRHSGPLFTSANMFRDGEMTADAEGCRLDGVNLVVLLVNSVNASHLRFSASSGLPQCLVHREEDTLEQVVGTPCEIRDALEQRGCDGMRISDKWITNHQRWIIWKLASVERRFSSVLAGHYLTYERLLDQLQHRFDKEVRRVQRSALKKILNRDMSATGMMILCVARQFTKDKADDDANKSESTSWGLELTDGWYSVLALPDEPLCRLIDRGVIRIGSKLLICNAQLLGSDDGVDPLDENYDPLQNKNSPYLRININSSRMAHWRATMGVVKPTPELQKQRGMLLVKSFSDVVAGGGSVPLIDFIVVHKYAMTYLVREEEGLPGQAKGKSQFIEEGDEFRRQQLIEKRRNNLMVELAEELESECCQEIDEQAPPIWLRLMQHPSPNEFFNELGENDKRAVMRWKENRESRVRKRMLDEMEARFEDHGLALPPSIPLLRIRVRDLSREDPEKDRRGEDEAILTIWKPSQEQLDLLQEGGTFRVKELVVGAKRFDGRLQLSANNRTCFSEVVHGLASSSTPSASRPWLGLVRLHVLLKKQNCDYSSTAFDTAGVALGPRHQQDGDSEWTMIVTDRSGLLLRIHGNMQVGQILPLTEIPVWTNSPGVICFRNLRVKGFDIAANVAIAEYGEESSFQTTFTESHGARLRQWAASDEGRLTLRCLAARVATRIPLLNHTASNQSVTIGYVAGFSVVTSTLLIIRVDTGGEYLNAWRFPLSLISKFSTEFGESEGTVLLNTDEESRISQLSSLGRIYRSRSLYRFVVQPASETMPEYPHSQCHFEVASVNIANICGLAEMYCASLELEEEE